MTNHFRRGKIYLYILLLTYTTFRENVQLFKLDKLYALPKKSMNELVELYTNCVDDNLCGSLGGLFRGLLSRLLVLPFCFSLSWESSSCSVGGHVSRTCHTPGESQELPIRHGSGSLVEDRWQHWKSPHFQFLNNNQWPPAEELRLLAAGSGTHRARQEKRKTYPNHGDSFNGSSWIWLKTCFWRHDCCPK